MDVEEGISVHMGDLTHMGLLVSAENRVLFH